MGHNRIKTSTVYSTIKRRIGRERVQERETGRDGWKENRLTQRERGGYIIYIFNIYNIHYTHPKAIFRGMVCKIELFGKISQKW